MRYSPLLFIKSTYSINSVKAHPCVPPHPMITRSKGHHSSMLSRLFCIFVTLSLCCFPLGATPPAGSAPQVQRNLHTCHHCQKQFTRQNNLTRHIASEHDKRTYPCKQCDKVFKHSASLKLHVRAKHEKITYSCEQCDKKFTRRSTLQLHVHEKHEKITYDCEQCDKKFTRRSTLQLHRNAKHPGSVYPCADCEQTFTRPHDLQKHQDRAHASRSYACPHCNKSYLHHYSLKCHCTKVHGVELATPSQQKTPRQGDTTPAHTQENPPLAPTSPQPTATETSPAASLDAEIDRWLHDTPIFPEEAPFYPFAADEQLATPIPHPLEPEDTLDFYSTSLLGQDMENWSDICLGEAPQLFFPPDEDDLEPPPKRPRLAFDPTSNPEDLP